MKKLIYQVYVGKNSNLYDYCIQSVQRYAERIGADYKIQKEPILKIAPDVNNKKSNRSRESYMKHGGFLPIYEKENAFTHLGEYDQVAIIDADVYIKKSAPDIFAEVGSDYDFGAVLENTMPLNVKYRAKVNGYSRGQYGPLLNEGKFKKHDNGYEFMNMGVMVLNKSIVPFFEGQTPKEFISRDEFKRFVDGEGAWKWSTDQTMLNYWIRKYPIRYKCMDWKWNGMFTAIDKIDECHFVHFILMSKLPGRGNNLDAIRRIVKE